MAWIGWFESTGAHERNKMKLVYENPKETAVNVLKGLELALGFAEKHGYMVVVKRGPSPNSFDFVMMESACEAKP